MECECGGFTCERRGMKCHTEARHGLAAEDTSDARHTRGDDVLKRSVTVAADSVRSAEQCSSLTARFGADGFPNPLIISANSLNKS